MQEIKEQPTTASEATDGLAAAALRAEAWAGEPFLREGEDAAVSLAPGTSRRRALDDALAEIEAGRREPSPGWKVQYGLMLGLERVLTEPRPHLASGTELRRHQVDALAGMLTELIASHEKEANGNGAVVEAVEDGTEPLRGGNPLTIQTYAWFARHQASLSRDAYQLVICDEAHTALGEKTSSAIRAFPEPIYIGMTATEQLIAKQVSDVFPASVDDLPLQDAARR